MTRHHCLKLQLEGEAPINTLVPLIFTCIAGLWSCVSSKETCIGLGSGSSWRARSLLTLELI
jgi:hypothetical protein